MIIDGNETSGDGDGSDRPREAPPLMLRAAITALERRVCARLVGHKKLARGIMIALLSDGHILLDGPPGLAKTRAVTATANLLEATFRRVALGPGQRMEHLFGTDVASSDEHSSRKGLVPNFANILLAESIDRASPEVRLALLDAMTERQVMIEDIPFLLPSVFLVCATRTLRAGAGDLESLASDERDRFLLHMRVGYPDEASERRILGLIRAELGPVPPQASQDKSRLPLTTILAARESLRAVRAGPQMLRWITALTSATRERNAGRNGLARWILGAVGPRGTIALDRCTRAHAWLSGRQHVTERDLEAVAHDVLRHRLDLIEGAAEQGVTVDRVIDELLVNSRA